MANLSALEARRGQLIDELSTAESLRQSAVRAKFSAQQRLDFSQNPQLKTQYQAQISQAQAQIDTQTQQLTSLRSQLAEIDSQIAVAQSTSTLPNQSTGQTVREDQAARNPGASPTNPPPGPEVVKLDENGRIVPAKENTSTNAQRYSPTTDTGTNASTRRASDTQGIPPITATPGGAAPNGGEYAYPNISGGASANNDDNSNGNNVKSVLNQWFGQAQRIVAQENPLDKFASYTYNISIYMMSPAQYKRLVATKDRNIAGWQLLIQSGGAPVGSSAAIPDDFGQYADTAAANAQQYLASQGRNQYFPLDFYIDDLRIQSFVQGKGTMSAHNIMEMRFKIYEPNSFSLFERLYLAAQQVNANAPGGELRVNYLAQNYLMVIKFYGYDDAGNLIRPTQKSGPNSDITSVIEKWVPFQFTGIQTRITNKITEYDCHCYTPQVTIAGGQARGVIPYNVELTSTTVDQLLNGTSQFGATTGASDDTARTSTAASNDVDAKSRGVNSQTGQSGWATANANAAKWASRQEQAARSMAAARGSPMPAEDTSYATLETKRAARAAEPSKNAPPKADAAPKTLIKGLVDALNKYQADLCTSSVPGQPPTYTYPDEYEIVIADDILKNAKIVPPGSPDKSTQPMITPTTAAQAKLGGKQSADNNSRNKSIEAGTSIIQFIDLVMRNSTYISDQQLYNIDPSTRAITKNGTPAQVAGWFHIGTEVQPLEYDPRREDYAYKIKYSVSLYAVSETKSDWFPDSVFRGTQKKYNYWFTGENTQVLDFTQDLNSLYYVVISGPSPERKEYTDYREFDKKSFQPRSNESDQGNRGKTFEPAANYADGLYSPYDTKRARLTIVGDPDWIQQGEAVFGIPITPYYGAFNSEDNSINFDAQEPLFEMLWNMPVDYNLWTGLMDPGQNNLFANRPQGEAGQARVSNIYRAFLCTSIFSRGRFTQEIEGAQVRFTLKENTKSTETSRTDTATGNVSQWTGLRQVQMQPALPSGTLPGSGKVGRWDTTYANSIPTGADQNSAASRLATTATAPSPLVTPASPTAPPTSAGQIVGPASTLGSATGGASGIGIGQPVQTEIVLKNGQTQQITSAAEIQSLRMQQLVEPQAANAAANRLRILQNAANNPITNTRSQLTAKENG